MSATDRQSRLLVTEDWKTVYQSFRNADFQSYDFDNLRRTMINYLRQNYPEDFNDYIESSEYLALIDLMAFLGQNLSFRIDLNARENFLETAERRESIIRLARLISYNPKRNQAANGLLKFDSVKTTESIFDSTGLNLAGISVKWNDRSNPNYLEQFNKILNAALPVSNIIGRPLSSANISGISTNQYRFNANLDREPVFSFTKDIEGVSTRFEITSTILRGDSIVEDPPLIANSPSFLFRNDGKGAGSSNTGYFMHFRQGRLESSTFRIDNPVPNQVVSIDAPDINDTDVWLYSVDSNGFETQLWTRLDSVEGNNIIYNSVFENNRNTYAVTTRVGDRINLVFSDGVFGNLPSGNFKIYYRTSSNANSVINPGAISGGTIAIPYISRNNTLETLTVTLSLKSTVNNGRASESNSSIKTNAPATYYTQNRLITGEDYNLGPLAISQDIIKTKSVNRVSSGISKYYDLRDPSGKYSSTNIFADDGVLYLEEYSQKTTFTFETQSDIEGVLYNAVEPILRNDDIKNFYYDKYDPVITSDINVIWRSVTNNTNANSGFFDDGFTNLSVGRFTDISLRFVEPGALLKFTPPLGLNGEVQYYTADGNITTDATLFGAKEYMWTRVSSVDGNGQGIDTNEVGKIILTDYIPSGSVLTNIIPIFSRILVDDVKVQIIDRVFAYRDFGLRYDTQDRRWKLVEAIDLNNTNQWSLGKAGDTTGQNLDSSWILYFKTDGQKYTVTSRKLRYIFESSDQIRFYFDSADKIYDSATGLVLRDKINVLNTNRRPDSLEPFSSDLNWSITDSYRDASGYIDTRKIQVKFFDSDDDGSPDDPELFDYIVAPSVNPINKIIFQEKYMTEDGVEDYRYFSNSNSQIIIKKNEADIGPWSQYNDFQTFYLQETNVFKTINKTNNQININSNYIARIGRSNLKFQYVHVADENYRIDPASSNIIDTYLLTQNYDTEFRKYLRGAILTPPLPPSSDELFRLYGNSINKIKSISDEVIYNPVKYKMLFGEKAHPDLQVIFKIVKNTGISLNDNELKAEVITAIDNFFSLENWDFGDTFYFQELSAYIMNTLSPRLLSVVIVPKQADKYFGSLFEIKSETDQIFISAATVNDVEIIDELTASTLQSAGPIVTATTSSTAGIQSSR